MSACAALTGLALFACVARDPRCLPPEHAPMLPYLAAIAEQESGFRPWAIRDEAAGESLFPATQAEAVRIATERDAAGRTLGLGWFQITHRYNWKRHGLTIETALDPCANMRAGAAHYAGNLRRAAFQDFNSGRLDGAPRYAAQTEQRIARLSSALSSIPAAPAAPPAPAQPTEPHPGAWDVWAAPASAPVVPSPAGDPEAPPAGAPEQPRLVVELSE